MKNLYSVATLLVVLSFSGAAFANANTKAEGPSYLEKTINKLPKSDGDKFRETMKEAHERNVALAQQIHSLHDDLDNIMAAKTFHEDAFRSKSAKLREVYENMRANTDDAFASASAELTPEERQTLAKAMAYPHTKHKAQ